MFFFKYLFNLKSNFYRIFREEFQNSSRISTFLKICWDIEQELNAHAEKYLLVPGIKFTRMSEYFSKAAKIVEIPEDNLAVLGKYFLFVFGIRFKIFKSNQMYISCFV